MKISRIRILPNYRKQWAKRLVKSLAAFLSKYGFTPAHSGVDATICIGGDGTIFYASHLNRIQGAVLGIGSKTSMVCQLRKDNWKRRILSMLRKGRTERRQKLLIKAKRRQYPCINDVVVHTHDYRVIRIFFTVSKRRYDFEGDGLIISTPAGSTGYAYSAGGRQLEASADYIQVVPICPYKRAIKPMLLSDGVAISIYADRSSDLIIDGIHVQRLKPAQKVLVALGKPILFLKER